MFSSLFIIIYIALDQSETRIRGHWVGIPLVKHGIDRHTKSGVYHLSMTSSMFITIYIALDQSEAKIKD